MPGGCRVGLEVVADESDDRVPNLPLLPGQQRDLLGFLEVGGGQTGWVGRRENLR
jgi:hypothetical protein